MCYLSNHTHTHTQYSMTSATSWWRSAQNLIGLWCWESWAAIQPRLLSKRAVALGPATRFSSLCLLIWSTQRTEQTTSALPACHEDSVTSHTSVPLFMLVALPGRPFHVLLCLLKSKSFYKAWPKYHLFCEALKSLQLGIHYFFLYAPQHFVCISFKEYFLLPRI